MCRSHYTNICLVSWVFIAIIWFKLNDGAVLGHTLQDFWSELVWPPNYISSDTHKKTLEKWHGEWYTTGGIWIKKNPAGHKMFCILGGVGDTLASLSSCLFEQFKHAAPALPSHHRFASDLGLLSQSSLNLSGTWKTGLKSCSLNMPEVIFHLSMGYISHVNQVDSDYFTTGGASTTLLTGSFFVIITPNAPATSLSLQ